MSSGREILFSSLRTRPLKRQYPHVLNGINSTFEDKTNDFLCPICFDIIREAHITRCGHTFCHHCITTAIEVNQRCPKCNYVLNTVDMIFPNFLLNELITKYRSRLKRSSGAADVLGAPRISTGDLRDVVTSESQNLSLPDVNAMLDVLTKRKQRLECESNLVKDRLVYDFLKSLLALKERQLNDVTRELGVIKKDIDEIGQRLADEEMCEEMQQPNEIGVKKEAVVPETEDLTEHETFSSIHKNTGTTESSLALRQKVIQNHFDDFVRCYFSCRAKEITFGRDKNIQDTLRSGLDTFSDNLVKFSRFSAMKPIATLNYSNDIYNNSTIVSSIEFDKDNEFFAIAGVTKRIKVYDYNIVIQDTVDIHYPVCEVTSLSKISCLSWNGYLKNILASSDYEGTVLVWDTAVSKRLSVFQEHEKRCWSVDFNSIDTRLIASGSDDARVKLWSINLERSIATLEAKANVCCVKFNPMSSCHLAFGSADHCVHYYDLRNMKQPLVAFKGHRKAVSYVKFLNHEDIISASTDSQLKLWNVNSSNCLRSFTGHTNEKNFVGLATDGDYIACGSENNSLYIYYKGLSKRLLSYKFDSGRSILEKEIKDEETNEFVSAVCWRPLSNVVVAANSQGVIKILELI